VQGHFKSHGIHSGGIFNYDNDGDLDIYVSNGSGRSNSLFSNQQNQSNELSFIDVALQAGVFETAQDSSGICIGDIDNDCDRDLLVLGNNDNNRLFENNGDASFTDISASSQLGNDIKTGSTCSMGDVNNDGLLDIVIANSFNFDSSLAIFVKPFAFIQHNQLFFNMGSNSFHDISAEAGLHSLAALPAQAQGSATISWSIALIDYDMDGYIDIIHSDDNAAIPFANTAELIVVLYISYKMVV